MTSGSAGACIVRNTGLVLVRQVLLRDARVVNHAPAILRRLTMSVQESILLSTHAGVPVPMRLSGPSLVLACGIRARTKETM